MVRHLSQLLTWRPARSDHGQGQEVLPRALSWNSPWWGCVDPTLQDMNFEDIDLFCQRSTFGLVEIQEISRS
jgi:hypothetical protein